MVHSLSWQLSVTRGFQLGGVWLRNAGRGALPPQLLHHLQQGGALHLQGQRSLLQLTLAAKKLLHRGFKALDPSICHLENERRDENVPASDYTDWGGGRRDGAGAVNAFTPPSGTLVPKQAYWRSVLVTEERPQLPVQVNWTLTNTLTFS